MQTSDQATTMDEDGKCVQTALPLPSAMTIETVDALASTLKEKEFAPPVLILDAEQTEIITTPGIQLLLSLAKSLEVRGIGLAITKQRTSFIQAFEQLGLAACLSEWEASRWLKQS